jgi:hypothetical protein
MHKFDLGTNMRDATQTLLYCKLNKTERALLQKENWQTLLPL